MKLAFALFPFLAGCAALPPANGVSAPLVDYHQHLVSPAFAPIVKLPERDGAALVRDLDAAGIQRAVVLSTGYSFADDRRNLPEADRLTREENDWTSAQVMAHTPRLIGFCGVNALREAALGEIRRCLALPGMTGIKLHFGNSGVSLRDPQHLARIQAVFAVAQQLRAPILVHMRARGGINYGGEDARLLLEQVVPMAPSIEVVVAHMGSAGPGYAQADEIMAVLGDAAQRRDPAMRNVYIDVASNVVAEADTAEVALIALRLRAVGINRVLYGSDLAPPGGSVAAGWHIFRSKLPLTAAEFRRIARNRTRFAR